MQVTERETQKERVPPSERIPGPNHRLVTRDLMSRRTGFAANMYLDVLKVFSLVGTRERVVSIRSLWEEPKGVSRRRGIVFSLIIVSASPSAPVFIEAARTSPKSLAVEKP